MEVEIPWIMREHFPLRNASSPGSYIILKNPLTIKCQVLNSGMMQQQSRTIAYQRNNKSHVT